MAWVSATVLQRSERGVLTRGLVLFVSGAALVPVAFFLYFRLHMPTGDALRAVGGAWATLFVTGITDNIFIQREWGWDAPLMNLTEC